MDTYCTRVLVPGVALTDLRSCTRCSFAGSCKDASWVFPQLQKAGDGQGSRPPDAIYPSWVLLKLLTRISSHQNDANKCNFDEWTSTWRAAWCLKFRCHINGGLFFFAKISHNAGFLQCAASRQRSGELQTLWAALQSSGAFGAVQPGNADGVSYPLDLMYSKPIQTQHWFSTSYSQEAQKIEWGQPSIGGSNGSNYCFATTMFVVFSL